MCVCVCVLTADHDLTGQIVWPAALVSFSCLSIYSVMIYHLCQWGYISAAVCLCVCL